MRYKIEHAGEVVVFTNNLRYGLQKLFDDTNVLFDIEDKYNKAKVLKAGEVYLLAANTYITAYEVDMMGGIILDVNY
ncbi:membrane-bound protein [Bacillus phage vB_BcgM]|nr:membrane-bound protein [Bacillus phage vB_BcgM]